MKTTKFFLMAALALTFAACSNDDNDIQSPAEQTAKAEGIPFTATISVANSAATRALEDKGTTIEATWVNDEEVALIYDVSGTPTRTDAKVTKQADGTATISATLETGATNGSNVTIIYPASAADGTTGNVKSDLLLAQNGELKGPGSIEEKYDVRKGTGKLSINGGNATVNNGTAGTNVSLTNQFAIFKFDVKNADASAPINVKPLTITIGAQDYVITPSSAKSTLYAALPAVSGKTVYFSATGSDNKTYIYSKDNVTFAATKYYQSTLKMKKGVIWTDSDLSSGSGYSSFTKDGITMNVGHCNFTYKEFMMYGTFTSTVGNFTKIEVTAGMIENMGDGWTVTGSFGNQKATWTGTASSNVSFGSHDPSAPTCHIEGAGEPVTMVFTLE